VQLHRRPREQHHQRRRDDLRAATTDATPTTTTPTPTKSPEDEAIEAAEKMIPLYFEVGDQFHCRTRQVRPRGAQEGCDLHAVDDMQNRVSAFQRPELKASGSTEVESMTNPRVDLKFDLKKSPPDVPTVQLDVCIDVSKLNVVDKDGKSPSQRPQASPAVAGRRFQLRVPEGRRLAHRLHRHQGG
jgi:hypothetical protein